jgi:triacylglycerol lipase
MGLSPWPEIAIKSGMQEDKMNNYPIVLSHGIARLDYLTNSILKRLNLFLWDRNNVFDRLHYFKGIASYLKDHGVEVYKSDVRFAASVEDRAKDLRREVERILERSGAQKLHIIAHSMGGLDGRHMIVDEGMANRVASLTTIGTPHLGTSFADWGLTHGGDNAIKILRKFIDLKGFLTLTIASREAFNERAQHFEATNNVFYQTYASSEESKQIFGPLRFSWKIINEHEGENDGLVSLHSQKWANELIGNGGETKRIMQHNFPIPADHLNQIGWWNLEKLNRPGWWKLKLVQEKRRFETAVRHAYLQIARDVTSL